MASTSIYPICHRTPFSASFHAFTGADVAFCRYPLTSVDLCWQVLTDTIRAGIQRFSLSGHPEPRLFSSTRSGWPARGSVASSATRMRSQPSAQLSSFPFLQVFPIEARMIFAAWGCFPLTIPTFSCRITDAYVISGMCNRRNLLFLQKQLNTPNGYVPLASVERYWQVLTDKRVINSYLRSNPNCCAGNRRPFDDMLDGIQHVLQLLCQC